jgi:GTPase SAR1 family protein
VEILLLILDFGIHQYVNSLLLNTYICIQGQEDYDRLRPLSYPGTNVFYILANMNSRRTFNNIVNKWYPEVHRYEPDASVIVIGCRWNRDSDNTIDSVSTEEALDVCNRINACAYVEAPIVSASDLVNAFKVAVTTGVSATLKQNGICSSHNINNDLINQLNLIESVKYFNETVKSSLLEPSRTKRSLSKIITSIFQSKPDKTDEIEFTL